jgi:nicotinamide phosphoribosyltransferase
MVPITSFKQLEFNPILDTDSYKASHWLQYPAGVSSMYSYFESRGGRFPATEFSGLQGFIEQYLLTPVTKAHVDEAAAFMDKHGEPFNRAGWMKIVDAYKGRFPVRIRAVPEGTIVPVQNVLFDIELTTRDSDVFWIVSWLETMLVRVWYATTVGTLSFFCKKAILEALQKSADDPEAEIAFKLHDFGSRGVSTNEGARVGGFAHLVNFLGSDTIEGIRYANHYYGVSGGMAGFSIPAAEHSTMTMYGRGPGEVAAYRNMVQKYLIDRKLPPGVPKIAACVSDSWDVFNAVEHIWLGELFDMVRNSGGKLVIRPDSGDPVDVLLKVLDIFDRKLGLKKNSKNFKVLPPYFGLIQGDGINYDSIQEILEAVMEKGYSASNLAFGMGGGLLQQVNRDTQKFAFKCAAAFIHEDWVDVMKDPVTDPGKKSKAGHQALLRGAGNGLGFHTVRGPRKDDCLEVVYENGTLVKTYTMDDLRARSNDGLARLVG